MFLSYMQTESKDPYLLKLEPDLQEKVDSELCRIALASVQGLSDRDWDLRQLRMQLEGWSQQQRNEPWPGACTVEASISREIHLTLSAAISAAARQHPYVCMEAVDPNDVDAASQDEQYLNIKAEQCGFDVALKDATYLALESRYAPMHISYEVPQSYRFEQNRETGQIERKLEVGKGRLNYRVINPWDLYPYPITATGPQLKQGCAILSERMALTEQDLILGVAHEGFDHDKVAQMLDAGPQADIATGDDDRDENDRDGIGDAGQSKSGGRWFCYQMVGRMPLIPDDDGDPQIPEPLRYSDCLWMVCPSLNLVFKQAYASHPENYRPYVLYRAVKKPNRWQGESPVSLISAMHEEMTSCIRFFINNMNLEASPTLTADERWKMKYPNWTIAPGRILPVMPGGQPPKPLTWDIKSQGLVQSAIDRLDNWCNRMAASQGMNTAMSGKVRKAAEVHFAEGMQQTKFDLYLSSIQEGVVETFEIMRALLRQHVDSEGDRAYANGQQAETTPDQLSKDVRFFAMAASDSLTPAARLSRMEGIAKIVMSYWDPQMHQAWQQQGCLSEMWHLHHRLLTMAGERSPERYLQADPGQQQQGQQGGQEQIVQVLQQLMGGAAGGQGGGTSTSPAPNLGGIQLMGGGDKQSAGLSLNGAH